MRGCYIMGGMATAREASMSQTACETAWPIKSSFRTWSMRAVARFSSRLERISLNRPADVREGDDDNVARVGDFVAEQARP